MRRVAMAAMAIGLALMWARAAAAELSREEIEAAIDKGVKFILSKQAADGHWPYYAPGPAESEDIQVGHTALAVLALQHSGSKNPGVTLGIKKGLTYIKQHFPERKTYSSGLVEQALFLDDPKGDAPLISAYAWQLISAQKRDGAQMGSWAYFTTTVPTNWLAQGLGPFGNVPKVDPQLDRSDNSNSQFAVLGLVYAEKSGYQVPRIVWERAKAYYQGSQHRDGGWDYYSDAYRAAGGTAQGGGAPTLSMTLAGTVSSYLIEEALADKRHGQCKTTPPNLVHEAGLKWIPAHWPERAGITACYTWYATERLGILIGYSEFGGHDWYQEGAKEVIGSVERDAWGQIVDPSFAVLFLARGRNPIIINKLKREGDWNLHRYDINNLIEHISGPWQTPCQWRIVTLDAKMEQLLKTPILWISGHQALKFTPEEKAKLKEYVEKGGTILAEDCCSSKPFEASFKELLKEEWPDNTLVDLPKTHPIFTSFRKLGEHAELMGMPMSGGQGRLGVIYIPHGISCRWEVGGAGARADLDLGACIYLYVDKTGKRLKAEAEEKAANPPTPETPAAVIAPEAPAAPATPEK